MPEFLTEPAFSIPDAALTHFRSAVDRGAAAELRERREAFAARGGTRIDAENQGAGVRIESMPLGQFRGDRLHAQPEFRQVRGALLGAVLAAAAIAVGPKGTVDNPKDVPVFACNAGATMVPTASNAPSLPPRSSSPLPGGIIRKVWSRGTPKPFPRG